MSKKTTADRKRKGEWWNQRDDFQSAPPEEEHFSRGAIKTKITTFTIKEIKYLGFSVKYFQKEASSTLGDLPFDFKKAIRNINKRLSIGIEGTTNETAEKIGDYANGLAISTDHRGKTDIEILKLAVGHLLELEEQARRVAPPSPQKEYA